MSIMFPTIFSLSLRGLGAATKAGSSFLVMAIVGGAALTAIMGRISVALIDQRRLGGSYGVLRRDSLVCVEFESRAIRLRENNRYAVG